MGAAWPCKSEELMLIFVARNVDEVGFDLLFLYAELDQTRTLTDGCCAGNGTNRAARPKDLNYLIARLLS
jgi:hypothetical protein